MMKKTLISLLSVGMFLGLFGAVGANNNISPNVTEEQTVQADTTNDSKTIHYEVYKDNNGSATDTLSTMNNLFTKSATIDPIDGGGYKVTLTTRDGVVSGVKSSDINGSQPTIVNDGLHHTKISFKIGGIDELNNPIKADLELQTKLLGLNLDKKPVWIKFDLSTLNGSGNNSFADTLNKITNADNDFTNSANDVKDFVSDLKSANNGNDDILSTPDNNTSTGTTTILQLTIKQQLTIIIVVIQQIQRRF